MQILGLIGYPLTHSFSRKYFTQKFINEDITNIEYVNFEIQNISDFPKLLKNHPNIVGLNVTIPYKQQILDYVDEMDEVVKNMGAANTLIIQKNNKIKAYNTDVYGFYESLLPLLNVHHKKALILGTGGASKAVAYSLDMLSIPYLFVSRNPLNKNEISYAEMDKKRMDSYQIIINTTPLGTYPEISVYPDIPYNFINENHIFYDLTYNPVKSIFLKKAEARGAIVYNGLKMLYLQAEKSWEIWSKKLS